MAPQDVQTLGGVLEIVDFVACERSRDCDIVIFLYPNCK